MSILIKGVEMPTGNDELRLIIRSNGQVVISHKTHYEEAEAVPAADVKPVIHAHWYVDDGCAYCSNCRNNFKKAIMKEAKYCPRCGAQIDGYGGHPDAGPPTPYDLLYEEGGAGTT